jgi:predicted nucleic acid-binding protein
MKFWDASAIVPLLIAQRSSVPLRAAHADDPLVLVWWATQIECASALARLDREGLLDDQGVRAAHKRLRQLAASWQEIDPSDDLRETAARLLRVHPLRAGDALQLAAAFVAASGRPSSLDVVVLDERLATAAQKEGFSIFEIAA